MPWESQPRFLLDLVIYMYSYVCIVYMLCMCIQNLQCDYSCYCCSFVSVFVNEEIKLQFLLVFFAGALFMFKPLHAIIVILLNV